MEGKVTILGSGGSMGVPVIGCMCAVCQSTHLYNKRSRPSISLQIAGKTCLFDCGPDFRVQALAAGIQTIDALILTHTHFDHTAGLDDLRIFCLRQKEAIPCYLSQTSLEDLKRRYYYLFEKDDDSVVRLDFRVLDKLSGHVPISDIPFTYFTYKQNSMSVTGYRIGDFAYVTDIKQYDESLFKELEGIDHLILSMQRKGESNAHLSLEDVLLIQKRIKPKHCYITHMGHDIDYHDLKVSLPSGIIPGFDGLSFWINLPD